MKNQILLIVVIVLLFSDQRASAQATYSAGVALHEQEVLATPVFMCDGSLNPVDFIATQDMKIFQVRVWVGMSMSGQGDFFYILKNYSTGDILVQNSWDHYAEPAGLNDNIDDLSFAPNYMLVETGETIRLNGKCSVAPGVSPLPTGQLSAVIWYIT